MSGLQQSMLNFGSGSFCYLVFSYTQSMCLSPFQLQDSILEGNVPLKKYINDKVA